MSRSSQLGRWVLRSPVRLASRSWVLFVTLVVAASGFSVLTGQAETARLGVVETAEANARSAYDVLVRPPGARLPLEDERGLVQPSFLVSYPQGITQEQWRDPGDPGGRGGCADRGDRVGDPVGAGQR